MAPLSFARIMKPAGVAVREHHQPSLGGQAAQEGELFRVVVDAEAARLHHGGVEYLQKRVLVIAPLDDDDLAHRYTARSCRREA